MRASFRLQGPDLLFRPDAGEDWSRRALAADALGRLGDTLAEYRRHVGREDRQRELLELGGRLFAWLDGDGWLRGLLKAPRPPLVIDYEAFDGDERARAFLRAPWELLAEGGSHLAARPALRYSPVRRTAPAGDPPAPPDYRLSLVFMAASPRDLEHDPRGLGVLDFEREEQAILDAAGGTGIELEVEESGDPEQLAERLARIEAPQALHLSCHGTSRPEPALLLEDALGGERPTGADELMEALSANPPRLLFLSACQTAQAAGLADSLAEGVLAAGVPAVMGWDGSVGDRGAIDFARELYERVGPRGDTVEQAAFYARRALLAAETPALARDWHLARLWLGPEGGGRLASREQKSRVFWDPDQGFRGFAEKENLDPLNQASPVASRAMFVGQRRQVQEALRALRDKRHGGVLVHGLGRQGKSSLAARIAQRLPEMTPVVVFGRYDALAVAEAIARTEPKLEDVVKKYRAQLPDDPARLEALLNEIVTGPCREPSRRDGATRALLLIVDDFERLLDLPEGGGKAGVKPEDQAVVRALLRAFDPGRTGSRLLVTSRYQFTLADGARDLAGRLHDLPLPPLDAASRRKLARRRLELVSGADAAVDHTDARAGLVAEASGLAQGSPGLQELLAGLALTAPVEAAETTFAELRAHFAAGGPVQRREAAEFFERVAVDRLLAHLGASDRGLLRAMTLFDLPVPVEAAAALAAAVGGDLARLFATGLLDGYEDVVDPRRRAVAISPFVRPRVIGGDTGLSDQEQETFARAVAPSLLGAWGGTKGDRPPPADATLAKLAALAQDAVLFAVTGSAALAHLNTIQAFTAAAALATAGLNLLKARDFPPSPTLLRWAGEVLVRVGEWKEAAEYFGQARDRLHVLHSNGRYADANLEALLLTAQAQLADRLGKPIEASHLHHNALEIYEALGDELGRAMALSDIAELLADRGEVDEALRRHEEILETRKSCGDHQLLAASLSKIARLRAQRGEIDEAMRLHQEAARAFDTLGDLRSRAIALGDIARLLAHKGETGAALRLHREALLTFETQGDNRERAVALGDIAELLADGGEVDEALRLHREALGVYERLGDRSARAAVLGRVARLLGGRDELDEASRLLDDALSTYEALGDPRSRAMVQSELARLRARVGEVDDALRIMQEVLTVARKLGDADGVGSACWGLAQLHLHRGEPAQAEPLVLECYAVLRRVGRLVELAPVAAMAGEILVGRGERERGLGMLREAAAVYRKFGEIEEAEKAESRIHRIEAGQALTYIPPM